MNLTPDPNVDSQECVGIPGQAEPAQARGATGADAPKSLMSSWTLRRLSKSSLTGPPGGPETRASLRPSAS